MDWLNLHTSVLDSPEFLGSDPIERGTWVCLLRYCIGQENGGTIRDCSEWGDRRWQQSVRITKREAHNECDLWSWLGDSIVVRFYPLNKEMEIQGKRKGGESTSDKKAAAARMNGALGGRPRKPISEQTHNQSETQQEPIEGEVEGEGKGKGITETEQGPEELTSDSPLGKRHMAFLRSHGFRWAKDHPEDANAALALIGRHGARIVGEACHALSMANPDGPIWLDDLRQETSKRLRAAIPKPAIVAPNTVLDQAYAIVDRIGWEAARKRIDVPESAIASDADLRDAMRENPTLAAEMLRDRAS